MKKLLLLLIIPFLSFGQDTPQFQLQPGAIDKIVISIDSLSAEKMYEKVMNWVKETYKNPTKVIMSEIKNEKLRINGYEKKAFGWTMMGTYINYDIDYSLEFEFKEGRVRVSYFPNQFYVSSDGTKCTFTHNLFWDEKTRKKKKQRERCDKAINDINQHMNRLVSSFYNYLQVPIQEDNW